MNRLLLLLALPLVVGASCSRRTTVYPVANTPNLPPAGFIYALPQTVYRFGVQAELLVVTPGPYAAYAQRYLGIADVAMEASAQWAITSVEVSQRAEADLKALFAYLPGTQQGAGHGLVLAQQGLIIPTSALQLAGEQRARLPAHPALAGPQPFTDLSHTPFIVTERTTHFSRVFQDSVFVRVPVHREIMVERAIEDKAREAADFIFSLRKRRFELLVGDADFIAEGQAVKPILQEIQRLEAQYLSLFTGESRTARHAYTFDYAPIGETSETAILFRFSPSKGVLPVGDLAGSPVVVSLSATETWQGVELLNQLASERGRPRTDALYYRIPAPVSVRLTHEQSNLLTARLLSFQHGPLVRIPANARF